jgi:hypothetical protein
LVVGMLNPDPRKRLAIHTRMPDSAAMDIDAGRSVRAVPGVVTADGELLDLRARTLPDMAASPNSTFVAPKCHICLREDHFTFRDLLPM